MLLMFLFCSHNEDREHVAKPAEIEDDHDAIEWELIELVEEHGSERQALRALLHEFHVLLDDPKQPISGRAANLWDSELIQFF
jgi:hypothetical protein